MALPIACTPALKGKAAEDFLKRIKKEEKDRRTLVDTPRLESVRKNVLADAESKK
jgi:hypothetical protein